MPSAIFRIDRSSTRALDPCVSIVRNLGNSQGVSKRGPPAPPCSMGPFTRFVRSCRYLLLSSLNMLLFGNAVVVSLGMEGLEPSRSSTINGF